MPSLNQEDIFLILKLLEESSFDELRLDTGELKLHANKRGSCRAPENPDRAAHPASPVIGLGTKEVEGSSKSLTEPTVPGEGPPPAAGMPGPPCEKAMEGLVAIKAPMLGTFYRTPKPGAPPLWKWGQGWAKTIRFASSRS